MNHKVRQARLGILGCGHFGTLHAEAFSNIRRAKLVGFCNRTIDKAENLRKRLGGGFATTDPEELIHSKNIDGVIIATHHDTHAEFCIKAALAGKHVLVEKPLGMSLKECQKIIEQAGQYASKISVGYKLRWAPTIQRARELLSRPLLIIGQFTEDVWSDTMWQQDPVRGGGSVLGNGCHTLDMIYYLAQSRPIRVYAEGDALSHLGHPCLDHMVGTVLFESGAMGVWIQGQSGTPVRASKYEFSLFGGKNIAIEIFNRVLNGIYRIDNRIEEMQSSGDQALFQQALGFVAQICDGAPPLCGLWEGLLPNLLLEACDRARKTHVAQEIRWNEDKPSIQIDC